MLNQSGGRIGRWKHLTLLLLIASSSVLGTLYIHARGNYEATAVLRYDQPLQDFRRMTTLLANGEAFDKWAASVTTASPDAVAVLRRAFVDKGGGAENVAPFFRLTRRDLRDLPSGGKEDEKALELFGIRMQFFGRSPELAEQLLRLASLYVRDVALRDATLVLAIGGRTQSVADAVRQENLVIVRRFGIDQLQLKKSELERLRASYPETATAGTRQLLSSAGDSSRFLPLALQLVGVESELIDARRDLSKLEREFEQVRARREFFERAAAALQQEQLGGAALSTLNRILADVLPAERLAKSEGLREVHNQLRAALSGLQIRYVDKPMFVSGDAVQVSQRMRMPIAAAIGGTIGAVCWIAVVFGPAAIRWLRRDEPA